MRRKQINQFINIPGFPKILKTMVAEFLSWFVLKVNATKPFVPVIEDMLEKSGAKTIYNLELGLGAGMETVKPFLNPTIEIINRLHPWDEINEEGLFVMVNAFHQLPVTEAKDLLKSIAEHKQPLVIVEGNNDSLWQIVGMTVFVPLSVLLATPFVKPFRWSRLFFTYIIPILPLILMIDGCIALIKLYNPDDLREITASLHIPDYQWEAGKKDNGRGGKIIYLTGRSM